MSDFNYRVLDPGIREVVRWLRDRGFNTTDSGDGITKFEKLGDEACALPFPHVFVTVDHPSQMAPEADRLAALLAEAGIAIGKMRQPAVEATYSPSDRRCVLALCGLDNAGLAEAGGAAKPPREWAIEMCDVFEVGHIVEMRTSHIAITECAEEMMLSSVTTDRPRIVCAACLDAVSDGATRTPDVAREWARAVECGVDYTYPPPPLPPIDELADLIREDGGLGETPALALLDEIQRMRKALAAPPTTTTDSNGATP